MLLNILLVSALILVFVGGWQLVMNLGVKLKCSQKNCGDTEAHSSCLGCKAVGQVIGDEGKR